MKRTLQFILAFVIALGIFVLPNNIAIAQGSKSIEDNRIRLSGSNNGGVSYGWHDFKFVNQGDGSARLKYISGGKIYEADQMPNNIALSTDTIIRFRDNMGSIYFEKNINIGQI